MTVGEARHYNRCVCGRSKLKRSTRCNACYRAAQVTSRISGHPPSTHDLCECGNPKTLRAKRCQRCGALRNLAIKPRGVKKNSFGEDLKLSADSCWDCGIRPAPEYDQPGLYVPVIVDNCCDDCRLRRRRLDTWWGSEDWRRAHTPMGPIGRERPPLYESGYGKITDIPLYLVAGDARDAHA